MNKRNFLKMSMLSALGLPMVSTVMGNTMNGEAAVVKQPEEFETFYVRENTPITFCISKASDPVSSVSLLSEELLPGSAIPIHKHLDADEFFFFISGTGSVTIEDKTFTFKAGTTAFIPKSTWHGIKNTGNEKAFFYFGFSPAGFEGFFREIGTPKGQPFKPKSKEEADAIAKKFGMVFK